MSGVSRNTRQNAPSFSRHMKAPTLAHVNRMPMRLARFEYLSLTLSACSRITAAFPFQYFLAGNLTHFRVHSSVTPLLSQRMVSSTIFLASSVTFFLSQFDADLQYGFGLRLENNAVSMFLLIHRADSLRCLGTACLPSCFPNESGGFRESHTMFGIPKPAFPHTRKF